LSKNYSKIGAVLQKQNSYFCAVKIFAAILSFLVLTLNCLPCPDDFDQKACEVKNGSGHRQKHRDKQNEEDTCSPFCHCTCCTGFSIAHIPVTASILVSFDTRLYSSYLPGPVINYSSAVWQPPRIG